MYVCLTLCIRQVPAAYLQRVDPAVTSNCSYPGCQRATYGAMVQWMDDAGETTVLRCASATLWYASLCYASLCYAMLAVGLWG